MTPNRLGRLPIAALMLTYNEAFNVAKSLGAVANLCAELHVVDSGSTDSTCSIAKEYGATIHRHAYIDHRDQLSWAYDTIAFKYDWILLIDADNIVTPELATEIREIDWVSTKHVAFYVKYDQFFRGRRVRGLKATNLSLFRKDRTRIDSSELVDFRIIVDGPVGHLKEAVWHFNENERDLDFWVDKHQRFARRIAVEEVLRGEGLLNWAFDPKWSGTHDERVVWLKATWYRLPLFIRPFLYFSYRYGLRLGFLDGWNGFAFHFLQAFWFRFLIDMWIADLRGQLAHGLVSLDELMAAYVPESNPAKERVAP